MFLSLHIPKTAGSTFRRHLELIFPDKLALDYSGSYQIEDPQSPGILGRSWRLINKIRVARQGRTSIRPTDECIHGHLNLQVYTDRFPSARIICWVRDPVDRVVSQYNHWKSRPDRGHSVSRRIHRESLSLHEFAQLDEMRNLMHKYLGGRNISDLWFVGVQEEFELSMTLFYHKLGVSPRQLGSFNAGTKPAPLPQSSAEVIARANELDGALYREAVARLRDEIESHVKESRSWTAR